MVTMFEWQLSSDATAQSPLCSLIAKCLAAGIPWAGMLVELRDDLADQEVVTVGTGGVRNFAGKHA